MPVFCAAVCIPMLIVIRAVIIMMPVRRPAGKIDGSVRTSQSAAQFKGNVFVYGAGVRLFFLHTQYGQHIDNCARFYFKLPRQLVDPDFLHRRELLDNSLQLRTLWPISRIYQWYQIPAFSPSSSPSPDSVKPRSTEGAADSPSTKPKSTTVMPSTLEVAAA